MKELTIEEKAKAYDKAIERAKSLIGDTIIEESGQHIAEVIFPELAESKDERIRKAIHIYLDWLDGRKDCQPKGDYTIKDMIAWLEKQGEQKPNYTTLVETGNGGINALVTREVSNSCDYEEKPVGKVEPKFHSGEWITNGDYTWKIIDVKPLDYILQSQDGNIVDDTISHVDEQFHSFTARDAKDGDVLVCPLPKGYEEQIFIFKGINSRDYVENCIEYYCRVCEGEFYENKTGYMGTTSSPLYPATKEQRDLLFTKMREAGYIWDAEKKELKKISQRMISAEAKEAMYAKPAWSEEDEKTLNEIFSVAARASLRKSTLFGISYDYIKWQNWLKSLKDRVQPQPKQEWSVEDEAMWAEISDLLWEGYKQSGSKFSWDDIRNWVNPKLKSLRPQKQWKPTKEQMDALAWALSLAKNCGEECAFDLRTLQDQLKKLTEE